MPNSVLFGISQHHLASLQRILEALARVALEFNRCVQPLIGLLSPYTLQLSRGSCRTANQIQISSFDFYGQIRLSAYAVGRLHRSSRSPRSDRSDLLLIPSHKLYFSDRGFIVAAPTIWNSLPPDLRSIVSLRFFRRRCKSIFPRVRLLGFMKSPPRLWFTLATMCALQILRYITWSL
jgi:hypothetical protein